MTAAFISVVDDDESVRDSTQTLLRSVGYKVATFESAELFLDANVLSETECLILDMRMPGIDGLELQRRLNSAEAGVPIIFVTAHYDQKNRQLALDGGASSFFQKPFGASEFLAAVRAAIETA
jgi:FixJ family two-component response regulator